MSVKKRMLFWVSLIILGSCGSGIVVQPAELLFVINQSFLAGLFLLMLGGLGAVIRSGFFTLFTRGFQQLKHVFFRKTRVLESDLYQADDPLFAQKKETLARIGTSLVLETGMSLVLFSIGLTCFYYL